MRAGRLLENRGSLLWKRGMIVMGSTAEGAPRSRIENHGNWSSTGDDLIVGECCDAVGGLIHNAVGGHLRQGRRQRERPGCTSASRTTV